MNDTIWSNIPMRVSQITSLYRLLIELPGSNTETIYKLWYSFPFPSMKTLRHTLDMLTDIDVLAVSSDKYSIPNSININEFNLSIIEGLVRKAEALGIESLIDINGITYRQQSDVYEIRKRLIKSHYLSIFTLIELYDEGVYSEPNGLIIVKTGSPLARLLENNSKFRKHSKHLTQLLSDLANHDEIGKIGEEFALEYELKRLKPQNNIPKIVSTENVSAGYDIESYQSEQSIQPDRFIEVKAISTLNRFFISMNEVGTMKRLSDKSFLYLVFLKPNHSLDRIEIYQNPYNKIFGTESDWNYKASIFEVSLI